MTVVHPSFLLLPRLVHQSCVVLFVTLLVSMFVAGQPRGVSAQTPSIILTIVCRSATDASVADIAVAVFDATSDTLVVEGTTDQQGSVRFPQLAPVAVRVRLAGTLQSGVTIRHTRQDQRGIWAQLPAHDWTMALRVDTDGLVFPDLDAASAGALDAEAATAISMGTLPTVGFGAAPATSTPMLPSSRALSTAVPTACPLPSTHDANGPGLFVLALLLGTLGGVTWLLLRGKA